MKTNVNVIQDKKEYPELTYEQVKELTKLMNEGKTEKEALELILND